MGLMDKNIGDIDKAVRVLIGLVLLYAALANIVEDAYNWLAILIAIAMFFTAWTGSCMLYTLLGISTCAAKAKPAAHAQKKAAKAKKRG
jgi:hypothetical protein